jgi:hypothetical protein
MADSDAVIVLLKETGFQVSSLNRASFVDYADSLGAALLLKGSRFPLLPLQVALPAGSQDYIIDPVTGRISINIAFNQAADSTTIKVGQTLILNTSQYPNAAGTYTPSAGGAQGVFTTSLDVDQLLFQQPDAEFILTLLGTNRGSGVVKDLAGNALDGDGDGQPGGDFSMTFVRVG